jgi:CubicO group peptidase (beta-lactamase class C family)
MGFGYIMDDSRPYPIMKPANEHGLLLGPPKPQLLPGPDQYMRRVGTLPLMNQPGQTWTYDVGLDVLGGLIARAASQPLETFLRERLFEPLGMQDTGFSVPAEQLERLATCYRTHRETGQLELYDAPDDNGQWSGTFVKADLTGAQR